MERLQFPLLGGRGSLTLAGDGDRIQAEARLADDGRGLYKAYLLGPGGRLSLGALTPEQGGLVLRRALSRAALERQGLWPPSGGEAELSFAFRQTVRPPPPPSGWRREPCPERFLGEPLLRRSAHGLQGALIRQEGDLLRLALPWQEGRPFPLTPLFCFAVPEELGQDRYAVFAFNGRGCPVFA